MLVRLRNALALLVLLALAWWAHAPGLGAGFLFDDFANLPALGATGPVDDWPTLWRYLTSGIADPIGRPLSLLSFLVDARDWPADPAPFLRTNLLIHLLNGTLLFCLLRVLGRGLDGASTRTDAASLLGTGLWLLHPLLVSTTLYIVQREAMLPATFILLGLLGYLHGRNVFQRAPRSAALWMAASIGLGTTLAVLCKANGVLLPLLAWVLEATVLKSGMRWRPRSPQSERALRRLRLALLVLPSVLVFVYLLSFLPQVDEPLPDRQWTIGQRLMTEPRVLLDYLQLLAIPRAMSTGLYNDAYIASTGLVQPAATLPAMLLILGLLAAGFALRRRSPAMAAALLFFFAGHLLESTIVPLELYFEHRNYVPALLLFWPLARALCHWQAPTAMRAVIFVSLLALCALVTHQRADTWGQPERMSLLWAARNPSSSRAQAIAAMVEIRRGQPGLALQRIGPLWRQHPHDLQLALNYADAACAARGLAPDEVDAVAQALRRADQGHQMAYRWLGRALDTAARGDCAGLELDTFATWLSAATTNPVMHAPGRRQDLAHLAGRLALVHGQPNAATRHFNDALAAYATPGAAARQAALLASQGHIAQALAHLDHYQRLAPYAVRETGWNMPRLHQWILETQRYGPRELEQLRATLRADLAARRARPAAASQAAPATPVTD